MPEPASGSLMGIDFGRRTLGLAVGHALTGSARPLEPVRYRDPAALDRALDKVIGQWRPARIIVGLPLSGDGSETEMSREVRVFARRLEALAPDAEVVLHDERLTSHAAAEHHAARRQQGRARRRDSQRLDSVAAALILESWMTEHA